MNKKEGGKPIRHVEGWMRAVVEGRRAMFAATFTDEF